MDNDQPIAYGVRQAAKTIGLSKTTVYNLINDGQIEAVRAGRRIIVPHKALLEYLDRQPAATHPTGV